MTTAVVYFSRSGNTRRLAEAIADALKAPIFDMATTQPSATENFGTLVLGAPVNGLNPAKEAMAFIKSMPKKEGKKAIVFCTYSLMKSGTLKKLQEELAAKGYETILSTCKKGMQPNKQVDLSTVVNQISTALGKQ